MQAQDYAGGLWAIGLRLPGSTVDVVQRAIAQHTVVRTWPLRGTLHFVAAVNEQHAEQITPGGGVFRATVVHHGNVIGTWKASATKRQARVTPQVFAPLSAAARRALEQAAHRYGEFLGKPGAVL